MPVDLKCVRQNPSVVEEWQRLRGRSPEVVQDVLRQDEIARSRLQSIQQTKRSLAAVKQRLRPSKNSAGDVSALSSATETFSREELLEEKKRLEELIASEEKLWKDAVQLTETLLWKVASQVDLSAFQGQQCEGGVALQPVEKPMLTVGDGDVLSQIGMELQHALKSYALRFFAEYPSMQLPRGLSVERVDTKDPTRNVAGVIDVDLAHSIWGCTGQSYGNSRGETEQVPLICKACPICQVETAEKTPTYPTRVKLPTWVRLLTEFVPPKSIWGDKQLPVFSAVWSSNDDIYDRISENDSTICLGDGAERLPGASPPLQSSFSLDLVALTASSMVDARHIQNEMANQITSFYETLIVNCTSSTTNERCARKLHTAPTDLSLHELSRMDVVIDVPSTSDGQTRTICLGRISCWGDAASRTCNMSFAGGGVRVTGKNKGGGQNIKDYVYVVQACVVDPCTWGKISSMNAKDPTIETSLKSLLAIPPILLPYLTHHENVLMKDVNGNAFVSWGDLFMNSCNKAKKKGGTIFGPLNKQAPRSTSQNVVITTAAIEKQDQYGLGPKFPPINLKEMNDPPKEPLSSFGFLFHNLSTCT
jgi:hypothetical protein